MPDWTKEDDAYLKSHKEAGEGATLIAVALGRSRHAICGRADRLGLGPWQSTVKAPPHTLPRIPRDAARQRERRQRAKQQRMAAMANLHIAPKHGPNMTKDQLRAMFESAWRNTVPA